MTTFYLLPPRPLVAEQFQRFLASWLPGQEIDADEVVEQAFRERPGSVVVFREELPEGVDVSEALAAYFGAEPWDRIVAVNAPVHPSSFILHPSSLPALPA